MFARRLLIAALLAWGLVASSQALVLPEGLAIDAPEGVDMTVQTITREGREKQVLAAWEGDTLRYFINVDKPLDGATEAQPYYRALLNDLRTAGINAEAAKRSDYPITSGLLGSYLVVKTRVPGQERIDHTVVHFITNGKETFVATVRLTAALTVDQLVEETVALFKSARMATPESTRGSSGTVLP